MYLLYYLHVCNQVCCCDMIFSHVRVRFLKIMSRWVSGWFSRSKKFNFWIIKLESIQPWSHETVFMAAFNLTIKHNRFWHVCWHRPFYNKRIAIVTWGKTPILKVKITYWLNYYAWCSLLAMITTTYIYET